jgi:uncharacterized membrane protein YfcA
MVRVITHHLAVTVLVVAISTVATLVRSTFGFGESLVAVPLFALLVPIEVAVPLSVLLSVLVAAVVVVHDRRSIELGSAKWLVASALCGVPLGLVILTTADERWVKLALGALIAGYSVYVLAASRVLHLERDHRGWLYGCGFVSGVLGGAYGLNGPPLVLYGNLRRWTPQQFRATLQAYFLPVSLVGLGGYTAKGLVSTTVLAWFALSLPVALPAIFVGRSLNRKLRGDAFSTYVHAALLAIGAVLIAFAIANRA